MKIIRHCYEKYLLRYYDYMNTNVLMSTICMNLLQVFQLVPQPLY